MSGVGLLPAQPRTQQPFSSRVQQTLLLRTGGRIGTTLLDTSHYLTHDPSFVHTHPQLCTFPTTLLWESLPDGPLSAALLSKWDIDCRETGMVSIPSYRFRPHPSRPRRASPSVDSTSTCLYCANNYAAAAGTDSSIRPTRKCDQYFLSPGCSQLAGWRTFYAPNILRNLRFSNPSGHSGV